MTSARETVLARIRAALADVPADEPPVWDAAEPAAAVAAGGATVAEGDAPVAGSGAAAYRRSSGLAPDAALDLLAARIAEYRATVTRVAGADQIEGTVANILARHDARTAVVPPGLPREWIPAGAEPLDDEPPLDNEALDRADAVLTGCALAIAQTGTIVLDAGPRSGRRAITLVPDLHICVVLAHQIVGSVPEAVAALDATIRAGRPLTLVSGPSATSDIELNRVEGVHAPRRLEVLLVE